MAMCLPWSSFLPVAHGDDFALVGLLGGGVGDDDAGSGLAFLFHALDDHAVVQRANLHYFPPDGNPCLNKSGSVRHETLALMSSEC
jgi:hypothetical protein